MSFFQAYFDLYESSKETAVCCPFEHHTANGLAYYENNPSAHINTFDNVFHCKACGAGHNETSFMQAILGCDLMHASKLKLCFANTEDMDNWEKHTNMSDAGKQFLQSLNISDEVVNELHIKATPIGAIQFPVFMYNHLIDIRLYTPNAKPKVRSRTGATSGLIMPYDVWRNTPKNKVTWLCAGEKDMAVARSHGLNAITITGGEMTTPGVTAEFKDRTVCIVYDNDEAGIQGAHKIAKKLHGIAKRIKIITGFHAVCTEKGEDITDFFNKYGKSVDDLKAYFKDTPDYVPSEDDTQSAYPIVDLLTASRSEYVNKMVRSNIQVVATNEASFLIPTQIIATKKYCSGNNDTMLAGMTKEWELTDDNVQDSLHLMDNNFKEATIRENIRTLLKIPQKEKGISTKHYAKKTVFKAYVTDLFETSMSDVIPMEYTAYSMGMKLESGKKYMVTYKIVPHPYKGQQLTMLITDAVQANDSVSNFQITEEIKHNLQKFVNTLLPYSTTTDKVSTVVKKFKGILGYNGNETLITAMDLAYHTVLEFNFGTFKNVRGYLDTLIVGESRVGKSSTAEALRKTYEIGVFTSLAGNAATIPGLIGGSSKTSGGAYQTRAGLIPQNHKGLIIFEEFGKSNNNIITELTDIRSSNEVRITRVSGTITMPANVRMITLTNVKTSEGQIKPIASYPHGIAVVTELVGTAEDIARYDMLVVLSDRGCSQIDPFWKPDEPFDKEVYQTRVRWVWSRTAEQVIIDETVGRYILDKANELNKEFDTHIKIFGTEAWKKISRLAIAVAGYLVSTDDTYENIIVTKDHVDFAVEFFKKLYDNGTFKLREYVIHEKQFSEVDDKAITALQDIYMKVPTLILQLEQCSRTSKAMLEAATGLNKDDLNKMLMLLTRGLFIRFNNHDIIPTERFRITMSRIERHTRAPRIGEGNA